MRALKVQSSDICTGILVCVSPSYIFYPVFPNFICFMNVLSIILEFLTQPQTLCRFEHNIYNFIYKIVGFKVKYSTVAMLS